MGSEPGFLSIWGTAAVWSSDRTIPVESEEWIIAEITASREVSQDLTREVGRRSSWQEESFGLWISSEILEGAGS